MESNDEKVYGGKNFNLDDILLDDENAEDKELEEYLNENTDDVVKDIYETKEAAATVEWENSDNSRSDGTYGRNKESGNMNDSGNKNDKKQGKKSRRNSSGSSRNINEKSRRNNKKKKKKNKSVLIAVISILAAVIILAAMFLIERYSPSKKVMDGYAYFDVEADDGVILFINGERISQSGKYIDGQVYLKQEDVADNLNIRFYSDAETGGILYTDTKTVYTFMPNASIYSDLEGNTYSEQYEIMKVIDGEAYLNFEYVAAHTACIYSYGHSPERVSVRTGSDELEVVHTKKAAAVRYRAGYKSDILETVNKGDVLYYKDKIDDWYKVITASGYTGYVKASEVTQVETMVSEYEYSDVYNCIKKDHKINMGWFQVTSAAGNSSFDSSMSSVTGMNTISPTWYTIADAAGNLTGSVTAAAVNKMHSMGLEVWPLVNDFDKNIDYKALFSSKKARANMINQLIWDASNYGYEGINIDFENVKADYAQDYLQFIRELSVICEKKNIILSTDNYKPQSFNSFYNLKEQAAFVDYVIIMGYDEHYAGSAAGSVASIGFVEEGIQDTLKQVPSEQVINAVPFYTRLWTVSSAGTTSVAVGMQSAIDAVNQNGGIAMWDDESAQYVCSYDKDGAQVRVWLEEEKSIEAKMKLYSVYNLAGAAEWKLGLEKPEIWNIITASLNY